MTRREELAREAARLFAEKGYHGTSIGALADAIGVQKGSLYAHIDGKRTFCTRRCGRAPRRSTGRSTEIPEELPATEKIRLALRGHLRVVAGQLGSATVFVQEWRYLDDERREQFVAERRRYEQRVRALFREGRERGELRSDLDENVAALLFLSAANWAFTWLRRDADTDALADAFYALLVDGMRGYATPS